MHRHATDGASTTPAALIRPWRTVGWVAALALTAALTPGLRAQSTLDLGAWRADGGGLYGSGGATVGGSVGVRSGALGVRGSLGAALDPAPFHAPDASDWFADMDVTLRVPLGGLEPYGFVGVGTEGRREVGRFREGNVSWGAGAALLPVSWLALNVEGRRRRPIDTPLAGAWSPWEMRLGVGLRLGGGRDRGKVRRRRIPDEFADGGGRDEAESRAAELYRRLGRDPREIEPPVDTRAPRAARFERTLPRDGAGYDAEGVAGSVLAAGEEHLGVPYLWGGDDPSAGFDCSGFVQTIYAEEGVALPRVSRDQARVGMPLPLDVDALLPGDLLFFASNGSRIDHVAVYAGDGLLLHSSSSGGGVRYDPLTSSRGSWFLRHWVEARRVI